MPLKTSQYWKQFYSPYPLKALHITIQQKNNQIKELPSCPSIFNPAYIL